MLDVGRLTSSPVAIDATVSRYGLSTSPSIIKQVGSTVITMYKQPLDFRTPQHLDRINAFLAEYRDFRIRLWTYQPSHSTLCLRVDRGAAGNFHLTLTGAESVVLPCVYWRLNGHVEFHKLDIGPQYTFVDAPAGASVSCGVVSLRENVEPLYVTQLEPPPN